MTASIEATDDSTERIATRILNTGYRVPSPLRIATTEALNHREAQIFPFGAPVFDKTNRVDAIKYAGSPAVRPRIPRSSCRRAPMR